MKTGKQPDKGKRQGKWITTRREQAKNMLNQPVLDLITPLSGKTEDEPFGTLLGDIFPDMGVSDSGEMFIRAVEGRE